MIHYIQAKNEDQWLWHCVKIYLNLKYFVEIKCAFPLLRTRPDGIAIFPGVCAGFALVVQVLSWSKQRNFQIYAEKHNFLGRTSTDSKYNTLS